MFLACRGEAGGMWEVLVDKLQVQSDTRGVRPHVENTGRQTERQTERQHPSSEQPGQTGKQLKTKTYSGLVDLLLALI